MRGPVNVTSPHCAMHATGGVDPVTPDLIGAADNTLSNITDPAAALYNIGAKPGDNLLINADFRCPVNRNGGQWLIPSGTPYYSDTGLTAQVGTLTEYTTGIAMTGVYGGAIVDGVVYYVDWTVAARGYNGTKYTIDRWQSNNAATVLSDSGLTVFGTSVYGNLSQLIENAPSLLAGKTVTLSALITGGSGVGNGAYINMFYKRDVEQAAYVQSVGVTSLTLTLPDDMTLLRAGLVSSSSARQSLDVKAAKLELGDKQTLARQLDDGTWELIDPPNYALQYALCSLYSPTTGEWVGYQHSNPNLLNNWYFADPIDQRQGYVVLPNTPYVITNSDGSVAGYTGDAYVKVDSFDGTTPRFTYNGTDVYCDASSVVRGYAGAGYTIDRFAMSDGMVMLIEEDKIVLKNTGTGVGVVYTYTHENNELGGRTCTCSALINNQIYEFTGEVAENPTADTAMGVAVIGDAGYIEYWSRADKREVWHFVVLAGAEMAIKAAKLELGPVQTLAHQDADGNWVLNDPPPNKALELAKCQRCYEQSVWQSALGVADSETYIYGATSYFFKATKRAFPAITVNPNPSQALMVHDVETLTQVEDAELAEPVAYNMGMYTPCIHSPSGAFVKGKMYKITIGDNAYFINSDL